MRSPFVVSTTISGNSAKVIRNALVSVVRHVDLCLLIDTGITDNTIEMAKQIAGDKLRVFPFQWVDDFSAARNFALKCAESTGAQWAITVDSDEQIQIDGILKAILKSYSHFNVLMAQNSSRSYTKDRIFRIPAIGKWEYPTHELYYGGAKHILKEVTFSEVNKTPEDYSKKLKRDLNILANHISLNDTDARSHFYLGQTYAESGQGENAVKEYKRCAELSTWDEEKGTALFRAGFELRKLKKYNEAIELCSWGQTIAPFMADLPWLISRCYTDTGDIRKAHIWDAITKTVIQQDTTSRVGFKHMEAYAKSANDFVIRPSKIHLVVVVGGEMANIIILDHFINHYKEVGVTNFHIFVHNNQEFYDRILSHGIEPEGMLTRFTEGIKCELFNHTINNIGQNDWCLTCDMDEFHDYKGKTFRETIAGRDCDYLFGELTDRFSPDGFTPMLSDRPLDQQYPHTSSGLKNLMGAHYHKILAVRRGFHIIDGHHALVTPNPKGIGPFKIDHYKWDRTALVRLQKDRGNHFSNIECQKLIAGINEGRLRKTIGLKPKILFISHEASRTGAPLVLLHLMRYIKQNTNFEFDIIVRYMDKAHMSVLLPDFSELAKVYIWPEYDSTSFGYDLIYCNTSTVHDLVSAMPFRCPVISHIHEMHSTMMTYAFSIPHMIERTSIYIPVSNTVANDLVRVGADRKKIVDPIGGPAALPEGSDGSSKKIKNDIFTIGFSGTCCYRKAFDRIPDLIKLVSERIPKDKFKMVWVGNVNAVCDGLVDRVWNTLREWGLDRNLILTGELKNPFPVYETFDILVIPSREDPFPLCGLEAASLGIPLICFSGLCGLDTFIGEDAGIVVPPHDFPAMADGIKRLKSNRVRNKMASIAKTKSRQYTVPIVCSKLIQIIEGQLNVQ